ncbi:surface glycoprotein [Haloplanus litoreus]|uniref:surface glycoprotein n=1 Tax=Haloplanus litoreus TaxID=767515 RepID=UPI00361A9729
MTDSKQKIRAVVLAALMVFSVFAGTVALSGTVAAQSAGSGNNTITPTSVAQDTTNDYDITVNATEVDTTDGSVNGDFVVDFKSLNLTTSSVITGTSIDAGNVTIDSPNTTVADGTETATLAFNDSTSDGLAATLSRSRSLSRTSSRPRPVTRTSITTSTTVRGQLSPVRHWTP